MTSETVLSELRPLAGVRPPWRVDRSRYMAAVYLQMAGAVMVSAAAAAFAAHNVLLAGLLFTANGLTETGWIVTFAPLILVIILGAGVDRLSVGTARALFVLYAVLTGLSLGGVVFVYSGGSIAYAFAAAAVAFAGLGAVGLFAKRDLGAIISTSLICFFRSCGPPVVANDELRPMRSAG